MIKSLQVIRKVWLLNMMKKFIGKLIIIFITTITLTGCGSLDNNAVSAMDEALSIESETTIPVIVREDNIKTDNQERS
jgi:hypothetical protein